MALRFAAVTDTPRCATSYQCEQSLPYPPPEGTQPETSAIWTWNPDPDQNSKADYDMKSPGLKEWRIAFKD